MPEPQIINAGIPGHNTRDILGRLDHDVLAHHPDLVLLLAGTNDCLNSRNLTPPEACAANYAAILDRLLPAARVVPATLLPFHPACLLRRHHPGDYGGLPPEERLRLANRTVAGLAARHGLPVVDLHATFTVLGAIGDAPESLLRNEANSGTPDGVHPTAAGSRLIAAQFYAVVRACGLAGSRCIVCLGDSITNGQYLDGAGTTEGDTWPAVLKRLLRNRS